MPGEGAGPALSVGRGLGRRPGQLAGRAADHGAAGGAGRAVLAVVQTQPAVAGLTAAVALRAGPWRGRLGHSSRWRSGERRLRAEKAEHEATAANDRTERTFARSLARPLDPHGDEENHGNLSETEDRALWELSLHQGKPIGLRFLDEATKDPIPCASSGPGRAGTDRRGRPRRGEAKAGVPAAERAASRTGRPLQSKAEVAFVALELEDRASPRPKRNAASLSKDWRGTSLTSTRHGGRG